MNKESCVGFDINGDVENYLVFYLFIIIFDRSIEFNYLVSLKEVIVFLIFLSLVFNCLSWNRKIVKINFWEVIVMLYDLR